MTNSEQQDKRKDALLEETIDAFHERFDIEHAFPPGDRPSRKKGFLNRLFNWFISRRDKNEQ